MMLFKKTLALLLCLLMILGTFSACGRTGEPETTEPQITEPVKEREVLKVLTLGHSLAVDSGHMLAMIADKEGYQGLKVGTLYYSGCHLDKHVELMTQNLPEYDLYLSSTETPDKIPQIVQSVTMQAALALDYWDIIIMQGGVFEVGRDATYQNDHIRKIQEYVKKNSLNPDPVFAWHMPWVPPTDNTLRDTYPYPGNNVYYKEYEPFNDDRATLYKAITKCVNDHVLNDGNFALVIPSGTAMENAMSSYLEEQDLYRDFAHASDLGRVIASYTWYCRLTGIEKLTDIKLDVVPRNFLKSTQLPMDIVLTDAEKAIIVESVNNALAEPLKVTQSSYTTAPDA